MVSTRGRYALRVMIDLAENGAGDYIPLKEVAARQEISRKYLESIMVSLSKNRLVEGIHGKGGGYKLIKPPEEYRVGDILSATEVSLSPVACLENEGGTCGRAVKCRTLDMWIKLDKIITDYLDGITIADLMKDSYVEGEQ